MKNRPELDLSIPKHITTVYLPKVNSVSSTLPLGKISIVIALGVLTTLVVVGTGYLVVYGNWIYAAVLLLAVPMLLALYRYPFLGVLVWLLMMPFLLHTEESASRQIYWLIHRFLPLGLVAFLLISSLAKQKNRYLPKLTIVEYFMGAYVVLSVISILLLNNQTMATLYRFYDLIFIPFCLYMVIRLSVLHRQSFQILIPVTVFIHVTQVVIGILSWVLPSILPSAWMEYAGARTTGSLNSVSVFTTTLTFSGLIILNYGIYSKKKWIRNLFISLFFMTIYSIFISYSRASWLAGILVLGSLIFMYPKFMAKVVLVVLVGLVALSPVLVQSQSITLAFSRLNSEESDNSALSRLPVYLAAIKMFSEKPIFGWGYDNFDRFDRQYQSRVGDLVNPDEKDHTVHNVFLTILAEQGLLGLITYLGPFLILLWQSRKVLENIPKTGILNKNLFYSLWLVILSFFIVQNLAPMVVVFGFGLNWITLALIANFIYVYKT
jgi:O-antigen ligase